MFYKGEDDRPRGYDYPPPSISSVVIKPEAPTQPRMLSREDANKIREAVKQSEKKAR